MDGGSAISVLSAQEATQLLKDLELSEMATAADDAVVADIITKMKQLQSRSPSFSRLWEQVREALTAQDTRAAIAVAEGLGTVFDGGIEHASFSRVLYIDPKVQIHQHHDGSDLLLPIEVAAAHELGHCMQSLEGDLYQRLLEKDQKSVLHGTTRYADKWSLQAKLKHSPRLEVDNIVRHEWPICTDLAWPCRLSYFSFAATADTALQFHALHAEAVQRIDGGEFDSVQKVKDLLAAISANANDYSHPLCSVLGSLVWDRLAVKGNALSQESWEIIDAGWTE